MTTKYLLAVDTKETPGKVKCVFVSFETQFIDATTFNNQRFHLLDQQLPEARLLKSLFTDK